MSEAKIQFLYDGSAGLRQTDTWKLPKGMSNISEEVSFYITSDDGRKWEDKPEGFSVEDKQVIEEYFKTPGKLKTSCPSVGQWYKAMENRIKTGAEDIFVFAMDTYRNEDGNPMSASKSNSKLAAQMIKDEYKDIAVNINILPHQTTSIALGILVLKFYEDIQHPNVTTQELTKRTLERSKKIHVAQLVEGLDYLHAGGRISKSEKFIGNILGIRPIIGLQDGHLVQKGKIRAKKTGSEEKLCQFMVDRIHQQVGEKAVRLAFADCQSPNMLKLLQEIADTKEFNEDKTKRLVSISPGVLSVHLGPSVVIGAMVENNKN